jgi:hypothetical protein
MDETFILVQRCVGVEMSVFLANVSFHDNIEDLW